MDVPIPSKRPRLSVEVKPNVSWTQDEWANFLVNECQTKEERARQIADQLVDQDFGTGRFESVLTECQLNTKLCKQLLQEIGFTNMDIISFIVALRRHVEKEKATNEKQKTIRHVEKEKATTEKQTQTIMSFANQKRPMCNELVWEVCKGIAVVKTSDRILLTSANIYAYLEKAFRKKLIYRDAIRFFKANNGFNFLIEIDHVEQNIEDELVVINKKETDSEYELWTNHLHIRLWRHRRRRLLATGCLIDEDVLENGHVYFFMQLVAPQLRPFVVDLSKYDGDDDGVLSAAFLLRKMHNSIDWVKLNAEQFSLEPISAVLNKCNKLEIRIWRIMDDDKDQQFCDSFVRWINAYNGGQPKMCLIPNNGIALQLLDAVNKDFAGATSKQPFAIRIQEEQLDEFTVRNARTGEQLQLRRTGETIYMLMRQQTELDANAKKQMEWEFDNVNEMFPLTTY